MFQNCPSDLNQSWDELARQQALEKMTYLTVKVTPISVNRISQRPPNRFPSKLEKKNAPLQFLVKTKAGPWPNCAFHGRKGWMFQSLFNFSAHSRRKYQVLRSSLAIACSFLCWLQRALALSMCPGQQGTRKHSNSMRNGSQYKKERDHDQQHERYLQILAWAFRSWRRWLVSSAWEVGEVTSFTFLGATPQAADSSARWRFYSAHCRVWATWQNARYPLFAHCPISVMKCISRRKMRSRPDIGPFADKDYFQS